MYHTAMKSQKTIGRREFLLAGLAIPAVPPLSSTWNLSESGPSRLGIPGPYPGRVVAVRHPGSIVSGSFQAEPIRSMMHQGMKALTGSQDWAEAWRVFFEPGDVVGIKVNPVGAPHVMSSAEVIYQIVDGLKTAGVKPRDVVVYDRYRRDYLAAGFDKMLPDGVRQSWATERYELVQLDINGYDPEHFVEMALVTPGQDPASPQARRSHAAKFITREVNKLINLAVLKDHQSAGVTLALKNLSHGLVNNVYRSHSTPTLNACGTFIPAVVNLPVIRQKTVLQILDGIKALYHGGPGANARFVWENKTLYFATDPVALDRIGWKIIDGKRVQMGMRPVAEAEPDPPFSTFLRRQPEHIEIAGALGLGEWDEKRIELKSFNLAD
jgi:uncharacterized protein (DUF362 family)